MFLISELKENPTEKYEEREMDGTDSL